MVAENLPKDHERGNNWESVSGAEMLCRNVGVVVVDLESRQTGMYPLHNILPLHSCFSADKI